MGKGEVRQDGSTFGRTYLAPAVARKEQSDVCRGYSWGRATTARNIRVFTENLVGSGFL